MSIELELTRLPTFLKMKCSQTRLAAEMMGNRPGGQHTWSRVRKGKNEFIKVDARNSRPGFLARPATVSSSATSMRQLV